MLTSSKSAHELVLLSELGLPGLQESAAYQHNLLRACCLLFGIRLSSFSRTREAIHKRREVRDKPLVNSLSGKFIHGELNRSLK